MTYDYENHGIVADLFLMLKICQMAQREGRLLISKDIVTFYKPDGVSDLPAVSRIFNQVSVMKDLKLNPFKIFAYNPIKFLRMIFKALLPHAIGKFFT
jgi:hypothetical protein